MGFLLCMKAMMEVYISIMNRKPGLPQRSSIIFWLALAMIALAGVALLWYTTPHGLALVNDSVNYIDGARNMLAGHGYSRILGNGNYAPVTNFPPFYSMVLAVFLLAGLDGITATWWVSIIFFAFNLVLIGWLGRKVTGSGLFGVLTSFLFLLNESFLNFHTFALSEPVFIFTFFLCLVFLVKYLEKPVWYWIALSGLFASLAYLTRYIGIALFVTAIAALVIFLPGLKRKLKSVLFFLAGAMPAVAAWTVRNILQTGSATNRQSMWHVIPGEAIQEGVLSFWSWLLPERYNLIERFIGFWQFLLFLLLIIALAAVIILSLRFWLLKTKPGLKIQFTWVIVIQAAAYLVLLVFTIAYLDASVNFEDRILMPIYNMLLLLIVAGLYWLWTRKKWLFKAAAVFITLALMLSFVEDTMDTIKLNRSQGQGFANEYWTESQTMAELARHPDLLVYTNRPRAVNLFLDRGAYILPSRLNPSTGLPWADYEKTVSSIRQRVLDGKALLVVFDYENATSDEEGQALMQDLTEGLPLLVEYSDGIIFGYAQK